MAWDELTFRLHPTQAGLEAADLANVIYLYNQDPPAVVPVSPKQTGVFGVKTAMDPWKPEGAKNWPQWGYVSFQGWQIMQASLSQRSRGKLRTDPEPGWRLSPMPLDHLAVIEGRLRTQGLNNGWGNRQSEIKWYPGLVLDPPFGAVGGGGSVGQFLQRTAQRLVDWKGAYYDWLRLQAPWLLPQVPPQQKQPEWRAAAQRFDPRLYPEPAWRSR